MSENNTKTVYLCGVDWQHEIGEAMDLEGSMPFYSSVEELKEKRTCWKQCGIIEAEIKMIKWVEPQDLFGKED